DDVARRCGQQFEIDRRRLWLPLLCLQATPLYLLIEDRYPEIQVVSGPAPFGFIGEVVVELDRSQRVEAHLSSLRLGDHFLERGGFQNRALQFRQLSFVAAGIDQRIVPVVAVLATSRLIRHRNPDGAAHEPLRQDTGIAAAATTASLST